MQYFPPRHKSEQIFITLEHYTEEEFLKERQPAADYFWLNGETKRNTLCIEAVFMAHCSRRAVFIGTNSTKFIPNTLLYYLWGASPPRPPATTDLDIFDSNVKNSHMFDWWRRS